MGSMTPFTIHRGTLIDISPHLPQPPTVAAWGAPNTLWLHPEGRRACLCLALSVQHMLQISPGEEGKSCGEISWEQG